MIDGLSLRQIIIDVGLDYNVGTGGSCLSMAQRQKGAIARAVLKRPDLLILNEATSALNGQDQTKVTNGIEKGICRPRDHLGAAPAILARNFDRALILSAGKLEEQGSVSELQGNSSLMSLLTAAE